MTKSEAQQLVQEWVKNENLINHMLCVEAAMRWYAHYFNQDEELWGLAGLIHDADWEKYPDEHPQKLLSYLREQNEDPDLIHAINAHGGKGAIEPSTLFDKALFACDEICGFVVAVARLRPNKLADLEVSSVKKKLKDKAFAANVKRADINHGAELLRVDLDQHIATVIGALKPLSERLFA